MGTQDYKVTCVNVFFWFIKINSNYIITIQKNIVNKAQVGEYFKKQKIKGMF